MYKHVNRLAWLVGFLMLAHSLFFWGGIGLTPNIGNWVKHQAVRNVDTFGVAFYTAAGEQTFNLIAPDAAREYAHNQVGEVLDEMAGKGAGSPEAIRAALPSNVALSHYGMPFAFAIALILHWIRPKPIKSLGR
jgi:hypothetical protein